mmetsp:Transcript_46941/g.95983  ORF Transcript_46941/g.95983 Transcript_46941/m.95983 type:complete len:148 (+) Transcript_46941:171-614(+)
MGTVFTKSPTASELLVAFRNKIKTLGHDIGIDSNDLHIEVVSDSVVAQLKAGNLNDWKAGIEKTGWESETSEEPFRVGSVEDLPEYLLQVVAQTVNCKVDDAPARIGAVWVARKYEERGDKSWSYRWWVFEVEGHAFRLLDYHFSKG